MKPFKKLLAAALLLLLTVTMLPGCSKPEYAVKIQMDTQYTYGTQSMQWGEDIPIDYRQLKNGYKFDISLPAGIKFLGLYRDVDKLVDENCMVCDAKDLKFLLKYHSSSINDKDIVSLTLKYELLHFDLELDFDGGGLSYLAPAEPVKTFHNLTVIDLFNNFSTYFPISWKEGTHFSAWLQENAEKQPLSGGLGWSSLSNYLSIPEEGATLRFKAQHNSGSEYRVSVYFPEASGTRDAQITWTVTAGDRLTKLSELSPSAAPKYKKSVFRWSRGCDKYRPFDGTVTEDIQLYYYELPYKTLSLNPLNGDAVGTAKVFDEIGPEYQDGWELAVPAGYTFGGWYTTRDCTGDPVLTDNSFTYNDEIPDGATLYAKWIKAA